MCGKCFVSVCLVLLLSLAVSSNSFNYFFPGSSRSEDVEESSSYKVLDTKLFTAILVYLLVLNNALIKK